MDRKATAEARLAARSYQTAKADNAEVDKRILKVFRAFKVAGESMDWGHRTSADFVVTDDSQIGYSMHGRSPADALNEISLEVLIHDRNEARTELAKARKAMNKLGITGLS